VNENGANLALIGMPGAGKSTLGVLVAKRGAHGFVDVDLLIQEAEGAQLREIIARRGADEFRRIEERCVLALECSNYVIATGGSVVYCDRAMAHLQQMARIVYLDAPLELLRERLGDLDLRGVVRSPGQDLDGLYAERRPLYERWADVHVDCRALDHDTLIEQILAAAGSVAR
jgi:shikimate kinase